MNDQTRIDGGTQGSPPVIDPTSRPVWAQVWGRLPSNEMWRINSVRLSPELSRAILSGVIQETDGAVFGTPEFAGTTRRRLEGLVNTKFLVPEVEFVFRLARDSSSDRPLYPATR